VCVAVDGAAVELRFPQALMSVRLINRTLARLFAVDIISPSFRPGRVDTVLPDQVCPLLSTAGKLLPMMRPNSRKLGACQFVLDIIVNYLFQHRQRHAAIGQYHIVEFLDVKLIAQTIHGQLAQFQYL